jgi:hypothetical protein
VSGYPICATAVINAEFERFCAATGHVALAEREGWFFVFGATFPTSSLRRAASAPLPGGATSTTLTGGIRKVRTAP